MANLIVPACFKRITNFDDLYDWDTLGVYVNLGTAPVKTARVGEGWIRDRARLQWSRVQRTGGLIAADLGDHRRDSKRDAQILEWVLLEEYIYRMGRLPRHNRIAGKSTIVKRALRNRAWIKFRLRGQSPINGRKLTAPLSVKIELENEGIVWHWGNQSRLFACSPYARRR